VSTFTAIRACSILLLGGVVLHAEDVTAGNGKVIDWRTVRCGETVQEGADAFDTAALFVSLVGPEAALLAATRDQDIEEAPPATEPAPRVHAYMMQANGGRLRSFEVGPFTVMVQAHSDDAAQAAFTERLASLAMGASS